MTHFTVGIIVPTDQLPTLDTFIHDQMAPYDEGLEVDPYVSYTLEKAKSEIERDIHRLTAILEADNAEAAIGEGHAGAVEEAVFIRATMNDGRGHAAHRFRGRCSASAQVQNPGDTAHGRWP